VVAYDEDTHEYDISYVERVFIHDGIIDPIHPFHFSPMLELKYTLNGEEKKTYVTSTHRYYDVAIQDYKQIQYFEVGDELASPEGTAIITEMNILPADVETVYNLDVEDHDNYIVNGILVANDK